jgi:tRNA pseudouridine13 synthase
MTYDYESSYEALSYVWPRLEAQATIRSVPEDFIVDEQLGFDADGEGEHVLLHIRKKGMNTDWVARSLARTAGIARKSVSFAGMKDRNAVTSQYFSVHLPGVKTEDEPDWTSLQSDQLEVLSARRHKRKLRRGALKANRFRLRLRGIEIDQAVVDERLNLIRNRGVPNYFMGQRFGHQCNNLVRAEKMLLDGQRIRDRHLRGIYLSAARSWLFNLVLSARIDANSWDAGIDGDSMMLDHSHSCFHVDSIDEELSQRLVTGEIHPTGPLWGRGDSMLSSAASGFELDALADWQSWMTGLEKMRMDMSRRRLRVNIHDLEWDWLENNVLGLSFSLPPGSYATAVLRELCSV